MRFRIADSVQRQLWLVRKDANDPSEETCLGWIRSGPPRVSGFAERAARARDSVLYFEPSPGVVLDAYDLECVQAALTGKLRDE